MSKENLKPLAVGATLVGGLVLSGAAFSMQPLPHGHMLGATAGNQTAVSDSVVKKSAEGCCGTAEKAAEGKCGEGRCGGSKCGDVEVPAGKGDKSATEEKSGGSKKALEEGKCGEGKCGAM